eukprot:9869910-Heterocapsa_arctica.AAC.2
MAIGNLVTGDDYPSGNCQVEQPLTVAMVTYKCDGVRTYTTTVRYRNPPLARKLHKSCKLAFRQPVIREEDCVKTLCTV